MKARDFIKIVSGYTMDTKVDYWRQLGIINPADHQKESIAIIGAGSIGSATALCLAKVGFKRITVWDSDKIEKHNLPNQLYPLDSVGQLKVEALADMVAYMTGTSITIMPFMFEEKYVWTETIVIAATDSMESRKMIWKTVKFKPNIKLYIDARMGGQLMRVFTVNPMSANECKRYEESLYTDEQSIDEPCSEKSIAYNIFGIASIITNQVKKRLKEEHLYNEIDFDYVTMMIETEDWNKD